MPLKKGSSEGKQEKPPKKAAAIPYSVSSKNRTKKYKGKK